MAYKYPVLEIPPMRLKNKGDYFQVQVIDELKKLRLSRTSSKTVGRQVIQAQMPGRDPEGICQGRR